VVRGPIVQVPKETRIPKKLGLFWTGCKLSWIRYMTVVSFVKLNPDWEVFVYTSPKWAEPSYGDGQIQDFHVKGGQCDWFPRLKELSNVSIVNWDIPDFEFEKLSPAHQSDLFSWWFLNNVEGFYSDFDILFIKPLKDFYNEIYHCHAVQMSLTNHVPIGFMGGCKNEFYTKLFEVGYRRALEEPTNYQSAGWYCMKKLFGSPFETRLNYGKTILQDIAKRYPKLLIKDVSSKWTVYPHSWVTADHLWTRLQTCLRASVFGIHWYGGHKVSLANSNIGYQDIRATGCTMHYWLNEIIRN
jgi:hypothetical protein